MSPSSAKPRVPKCLGCGYTLTGLGPQALCPECAREFDLHSPTTFTYNRPFLGWRYWGTGFGVAAGIGIALMLVETLGVGSGGWSVWIATPLLIGLMCGYAVRLRAYALVLLCLLLFGCLLLGLMAGGVAGVFCGMILAGIALVPLVVGALLGHGLRAIIRAMGYDLRKPLLICIACVASLGCSIYERLTALPAPIRNVSTTATVAAPIDTCFDAIMFYEEVKHPAPWILRIGLARPLRTIGSSRSIGDVKTCLYNKGHITKRVTDVDRPNRLAFDVIEQQIGYERDVRLISGSFELAAGSSGRTSITLTTTYRPLLGPRWAWEWGEDYAIHTLHAHVLEGMRRKAEDEPAPTAMALPGRESNP